MQTEQLAKVGFAIAVAGAIIAGLATVGGPATGRMEKRDQARLQDVQAISAYVTCVARARDKTLPNSLDGNKECPRTLDREDPFDGTAYIFRKLDENSYEICANLELSDAVQSWQARNLNKETGCIHYDYSR